MTTRRALTLRHEATGRLVPVDVVTVVGRNDTYYRYCEGDERADRLRGDVAEGLAALNYIKVSSDSRVSRTHGVFDPAGPSGPTVSDLNSTNGTFLNERRLPAGHGEPGAAAALSHGDAVALGAQRFAVELLDQSDDERDARLRSTRRGCIACDWAHLERAERIARHLEERKGFQMRPAVGWAAAIATCYQLQSSADPDGVAVLGFSAEASGDQLVFDGEPMAFAKLLPVIANIPGRKVVVLDVDGDPTTCEQLFASQGFEDMLLLACAGGPAVEAPPASSALVRTIGTGTLDSLKQALSGEHDLKGAHDDVLDGLDALIPIDTNVLVVSWIATYRGRVSVTFGERAREDDSWLSHSLRLQSTTFRF